MKKIFTLITILVVIVSCTSSRKQSIKGNYDAAISKSVKKLKKDPGNEKEAMVLEEAYDQANRIDNERISYLKQEGRPESWDEIFRRYSSLDSRQNLIKTLPPIGVNLPTKEYNSEMIQAKQKAAEFAYANGERLIVFGRQGDRVKAREAHASYQRAKDLIFNFKDVDQRLNECLFLGTSNALFSIENRTQILLPPNFHMELKKVSLKELNRQWLNYDTDLDTSKFYDYSIQVNLKVIDISPETIEKLQRDETKEVPDGFEYVLDAKGNVMRDTLGNDVKVPKTKIIKCTIFEEHQHKAAMLSGSVDYFDNRSRQLLKTEPITTEVVFDHRSGTALGDLNAMKPESKGIIGIKPLPFPPDQAMLMDASALLKDIVKGIINQNSGIFQ